MQVTVDYILKAHEEGDMEKVARLSQLQEGAALCSDYCGRTILHRAVLAGNTQTVKRVLELEPKLLNVQDNVSFTWSLACVCVWGGGYCTWDIRDYGKLLGLSESTQWLIQDFQRGGGGGLPTLYGGH